MSLASAIHDMVAPAFHAAVQSGGAKKAKGGNGLLLFVIILALFLIRTYIVQFSFNRAVPALVVRLAAKPEKILANFRPLTFVEAMFVTLLASALFN